MTQQRTSSTQRRRDLACNSCGAAYTAATPNQIYCSSQCRQREKIRMARERNASASSEKKEAMRARRRELDKKRRAADPDRYRAYERKYNAAHPGRHRAYYAANPDKYREYWGKRLSTNRDQINKRRRQYYAANLDKCRERNRRYHALHASEINERVRSRRAADPEKYRKYDRQRYALHPEKKKKRARNYYFRNSERIRKRERERHASLVRAAWRPADWWDRPLRWRVIGTELFSKDQVSNKELAQRLDSSGIFKCPYGDTWTSSVDARGCFEFFRKIRNWVRKPGRIPKKRLTSDRPSIQS